MRDFCLGAYVPNRILTSIYATLQIPVSPLPSRCNNATLLFQINRVSLLRLFKQIVGKLVIGSIGLGYIKVNVFTFPKHHPVGRLHIRRYMVAHIPGNSRLRRNYIDAGMTKLAVTKQK